ncbi:class I SAM-dependent methyltransferase [Thalassospira sp. CH_XMU1448-2]|jgi:2-polyprenyl-3-methyl-5-hydroxy-6-metoxy-1,4-benzoquinol methylase|uniref:class I SAM-dependent methyltransferase n=1 Tax=Thalassospira sp. CH_XMU1448-2 TaxID=3107773 RepID=UPI0030089CFB
MSRWPLKRLLSNARAFTGSAPRPSGENVSGEEKTAERDNSHTESIWGSFFRFYSSALVELAGQNAPSLSNLAVRGDEHSAAIRSIVECDNKAVIASKKLEAQLLPELTECAEKAKRPLHLLGSTDVAKIEESLCGQRISAILTQSAEELEQVFRSYGKYLADQVLLYVGGGSPLAEGSMSRELFDERALHSWGSLGSGAWLGQWGGQFPASKDVLSVDIKALVDRRTIAKELDSLTSLEKLFAVDLPASWEVYSDDSTGGSSPVLVFENGELIGPAHSDYKTIAEQGGGAYCHRANRLWFSAAFVENPCDVDTVYEIRLGSESLQFTGRHNPHFEHKMVVWDDALTKIYQPAVWSKQFDGQWKLFLEEAPGFVKHTGVDTSDEYIDDRIHELTGVSHFLHKEKWGQLSHSILCANGALERAERRGVGGRLFLEPKFPIDYFKGKRCLDIGCGAGRWTKTMLSLGGKVKSLDASESGVKSTRRFNADVEQCNLFDLKSKRSDLHGKFDFVLCWGVVMCTHDPLVAFENVASTVKPGGELYIMVYAPTYHASEFVVSNREHYHRELRSPRERTEFLKELTKDDSDNAINYLDMLNTEYNWTIDEHTLVGWAERFGFETPVFLNRNEPHKGAHHVLYRRKQ